MKTPEKPCPWHAVETDTGRLVIVYCEVGPAGHEGGHIGTRSRVEYLKRMRMWNRASRNVNTRKEHVGDTTKESR